jgi:hypothetical protein
VTKHTREQFTAIVETLNQFWTDKMTFELVGSLTEKSESDHDADIAVYPLPGLPPGIPVEGFINGCRKSGAEVVEVDRESKGPFPGRPDGQDRIRVRFTTGQVIDFFFAKGQRMHS